VKIDLKSIDREHFRVDEHIVIATGETVYLVYPDPDAPSPEWNSQNKIFRSSVWNYDGELISAGFPKFMNWGENSINFPVPKSLDNCTVVEKVDGSLFIVSKYRNQYIFRTRRKLDATELPNGHEIEIFKELILPKISRIFPDETWPVSWLFEWTSPNQQIVINYGDRPRFRFVGMIDHNDYTIVEQELLDQVAQNNGLERPMTHKFTSLESLITEVNKWEGAEGVCVYKNQSIHKVKSAWYLVRHRLATELSSRDKVIKLWVASGRPKYNDFFNQIAEEFDFELATKVRGDISIICDAYKEVLEIIKGFQKFIVERLNPLGSALEKGPRKEMAKIVLSSYGKTNRANFVFKLAEGRELSDEDIEKLLYQCIKNR